MTSKIKYKTRYNFGSRFDFDLWFFLKVILLLQKCLKISGKRFTEQNKIS